MFTSLRKPLDVIAIGDITCDAFIKIKEAGVYCNIDNNRCEICMKFGDKVPFESAEEICGVGNSPNAAVAMARLGLRSTLVATVGSDKHGRECVANLVAAHVDTSLIHTEHGKPTNYHYVIWYGAERTILVNHVQFNYKTAHLPPARWIYLSSMGAGSEAVLDKVADYLEKNPATKLCFQPGTFQMKLGQTRLDRIYRRTEVFCVNVEEAQRILETEDRTLPALMDRLATFGPRIVLVTDGPKGAYMRDADGKHYFMPPYPDPKPPYERTGCGDAFSATFVAALAMGRNSIDALRLAPINSMSVVQYTGAQKGLLTRAELEGFLAKAPADYIPRPL